jgi:hypothetical protein
MQSPGVSTTALWRPPAMATDPKATPLSEQDLIKGIKVFTYPKLIFLFPTLIAALVCGTLMWFLGNPTEDPVKHPHAVVKAEGAAPAAAASPAPGADTTRMARHQRFVTPQNLLGVLFLGIFGFNLIVLGLDFPRFTVVAVLLAILLAVFVLLWVGAYFEANLMQPARSIFGRIYTVANSEFYFMIAAIIAVNFTIIYVTRWLDYWEILPNEILHHHGPLSDLERYPTTNLKFDKEIPDVFEFLFLGAGRLVLHVTEERKSIVLDNVLFIGSKEVALKRLMSRMEVRVTTDQEIARE